MQSRNRIAIGLFGVLLVAAGLDLILTYRNIYDQVSGSSKLLLSIIGGLLVAIGLFIEVHYVIGWERVPVVSGSKEESKYMALHKRQKALISRGGEKDLASQLINKLTLNGRLVPHLPLMGLTIIFADLIVTFFISSNSSIGSFDMVVLLFGGILLAYNYIPSGFDRERDFSTLFLLCLFILLVLPSSISSAFSDESGIEAYSTPINIFLVKPLIGILNLIGIHASEFDPMTIRIALADGTTSVPVQIAISCAGLYSVAIFISAFIAFVAVEYSKFDRRVGILLGLGIFTAYVANILRMALLFVIYHHYDFDTFNWAHKNLGLLIFLIWVSFFWLLMFRFLDVKGDEPVISDGSDE